MPDPARPASAARQPCPAGASPQAPQAVVMVRPTRFTPNPLTVGDNHFQQTAHGLSADTLATRAYAECTQAALALCTQGVQVHLFDDDGRADTPDAVFPNNWFSTHAGGHVALYPMYSPNRRRERRADIIDLLKTAYRVQDVIDYSGLEADGLFLEGTGAMVLDHLARVAYVARSHRAHPVALERFATHFNFEPLVFDTADDQGRPVYHTNVLMAVATDFALVGLDLICDPMRRAEVVQRLEESGKEVLALSRSQVADYAGNALELGSPQGRLLALSTRALQSLKPSQIERIERSARLLPLDVPTVELAGGSVRCMLAGVHLARRPAQCSADVAEMPVLIANN